MPAKTALLFIDDDCVKIVIGESLKVIKFNTLKADHNVQLLEKLFSSCTVFTIKELVELSKESFVRHVSDKIEKTQAAPLAKTAALVALTEEKRSAATIVAEAEEESDRMLFRSVDETTIVVDDLPTGEESPNRPGVKMTLVVTPYKAVDLSDLPEDAVRNSKQLKRLIREGTLVPCTRAEASSLQQQYDSKMKEDADARIDTAAPILKESAADFVAKTAKGGKFDWNNSDHDATTIDITDDGGDEPEMEKLMRMAGASDDEPPPDLPLPKKKMTTTAQAQGTVGIKAKGISRSEKTE